MALATATISGPILRPGGTRPLALEVTLEAVAESGTVKSPSEDVLLAGRESWQSARNGVLTVPNLPQLPQAAITPPEARWQATFTILDDRGKRPSGQQTLKPIQFELTGNTTWTDLVDVSGAPITETLLSLIAAARDEALAARDAAVAAKVAAEAVGTTNDTVIASRVNDRASATAAALAPQVGVRPAAGTGNDLAAIHAARDAAATYGAPVFIDRAFTIAGTIAANVANQEWNFGALGSIALANGANSDAITVSAANVKLHNPVINGNRTNQTGGSGGILVSGANAAINAPVITNVRARAINVFATKVAVRNGDFSDYAEAAVSVTAPSGVSLSGVQVTGNRIYSGRAGAYGILVHGTTPAIVDSSRISDNDVSLLVGPAEGLCIEVYGLSPHSTISGNICRGGQMGISVSDADGSAVVGNVVIGPHLYGIEVAASEHVAVTGNAVNGNGVTTRLISCSNAGLGHLVISGNTLFDWNAAGYAIRISGANFLTITGNDIDGPYQPMYLATCDHFVIQGNTVDGGGTSVDAVNLDTCGGGIVSQNVWHGFSRSGVVAYGGAMAGHEIGPNRLTSTPIDYKPFATLGAGTIVRGQRGTTRPNAAEVGDGADFYDQTLNRPIWSDGATWRDSAGVAV